MEFKFEILISFKIWLLIYGNLHVKPLKKNIWWKQIGSKISIGKKNWGSKEVEIRKKNTSENIAKKLFVVKKVVSQKIFDQEKIQSKKI